MCVCRCSVRDIEGSDATSDGSEMWLSVCAEASGLEHKRADVCRRQVLECSVYGRGVTVQQGFAAAETLARCFSPRSYYCWFICSMARDAAKAAVRGLHVCSGLQVRSFYLDANRFHPAEFLDQLSVLDKDAERHRRKARRAAKHAD